jgi:glycosidase
VRRSCGSGQRVLRGGTIRGITQHLGYIAGLGCIAIWLSPIFENNPGAYHGDNIKII